MDVRLTNGKDYMEDIAIKYYLLRFCLPHLLIWILLRFVSMSSASQALLVLVFLPFCLYISSKDFIVKKIMIR